MSAIIISGMMFALYHLGYPGFRTFGDILLLFAVGMGFAIVVVVTLGLILIAFYGMKKTKNKINIDTRMHV